jgi:hypothetical protein
MTYKYRSVVIAISHAEVHPWIEIKETQEKTWIKNSPNNVNVIFYLSKPAPFVIKHIDFLIEKYRFSTKYGKIVTFINKTSAKFISHKIPKYVFNENTNSLVVDSWSTYQLFGRRNLALFDWFLRTTNADYLYQTNVSSYISVNKFIEMLNEFDKKDLIYAGSIINPDRSPFPIVSGSGKLLSRNLVVEIMKNPKLLKFDNLEDVGLAESVSKIGVEAFALPRLDLPNLNKLRSCSKSELASHFQFRCKSDSIPRIDVQIMEELHTRLFDNTYKSDNSDIIS